MILRWREAFLVLLVSGFAWYLFLTPHQGATSVDSQAKAAYERGRDVFSISLEGLDRVVKSIVIH